MLYNDRANRLNKVQMLVQAGMLAEALKTFSEISDAVASEPELLADKIFQRDFREAEYSLNRIVRDEIEMIYRLSQDGHVRDAWARAMNLMSILENAPIRGHFREYQYQLRDLMEQLVKERYAEEKYFEILRLVEHHELGTALNQLSILREEVYPRARIRHEIERLFDDLRGITNVTLTSVKRDISHVSPQAKLTAQYLEKDIAPFLNAVAEIQRLLDGLLGREIKDVAIRVISQNSPIGVSLEGVSDTFLAVTDLLIPWKRKHAEKMAEYARREKQYEIEKKRIELHEANLQLVKSQQEIEMSSAEIAKLREETEKLRTENEKARLELGRVKIQLALDILAKVAPNLSETDKLSSLVRLLPLLDTVIGSDIEITRKE